MSSSVVMVLSPLRVVLVVLAVVAARDSGEKKSLAFSKPSSFRDFADMRRPVLLIFKAHPISYNSKAWKDLGLKVLPAYLTRIAGKVLVALLVADALRGIGIRHGGQTRDLCV